LKFQAVAEKTAKDARGLLYFAAPGTMTSPLMVYYRDGTGSVTLTRDPTRPGTPVTRWPGLARCFGGVQAYWPNLANKPVQLGILIKEISK